MIRPEEMVNLLMLALSDKAQFEATIKNLSTGDIMLLDYCIEFVKCYAETMLVGMAGKTLQ